MGTCASWWIDLSIDAQILPELLMFVMVLLAGLFIYGWNREDAFPFQCRDFVFQGLVMLHAWFQAFHQNRVVSKWFVWSIVRDGFKSYGVRSPARMLCCPPHSLIHRWPHFLAAPMTRRIALAMSEGWETSLPRTDGTTHSPASFY